jgi:uncharacterized protein (TIGR02145 family)
MKTPSKRLLVVFITVTTLLTGCKKDTVIDNNKIFSESIIIAGSNQFDGDIPIPNDVTNEWSIDTVFSIFNEGGIVKMNASSKESIILLLIQIDGIDKYFQVAYTSDGDIVFAKKDEAEAVLERQLQLGLILWSNKLPSTFQVKATITGIINSQFETLPDRPWLEGIPKELWLKPKKIVFNINSNKVPFNCGLSFVRDFDNNLYETVEIGTQCWLKLNLVSRSFNDGTPIPYVGGESWKTLTTGAYRDYYNNQPYTTYDGFLYNGFAALNPKICPIGWHIPSMTEWETLATSLGGKDVAGGKMKTITRWEAPNTGATNSSGFTVFPSGNITPFSLQVEGEQRNYTAFFWSTTESPLPYTNALSSAILEYTNEKLNISHGSTKNYGFSCRCIKD